MSSETSTPAEPATVVAPSPEESEPARRPRRRHRLVLVLDVAAAIAMIATATALMLAYAGSRDTQTPAAGQSGTWIVGLAEIPRTTDLKERDRQLADLQQQIPGASLVDSEAWASLPPGTWVVRAPGEFADGFAALTHCGTLGSDECTARYLSQDEDDQDYVCEAEPTPDPGTCRHPGDRTEAPSR